MRECSVTDGGDRVRDGHVRQAITAIEGITAYRGDRITDRHTHQFIAVIERCISYRGDRIGNRHICRAAALSERSSTNGGDSARNDGVTATGDQRVACRLDDGVAIATGIVGRVSTGHHDARHQRKPRMQRSQ